MNHLPDNKFYVLEAVVIALDQTDANVSTVTLNDCVFRQYDDNTLVSDSLPLAVANEAQATVLNSVIPFQPLEITGNPAPFLVWKNGDDIRIQAVNKAGQHLESLTRQFTEFSLLVDNHQNVRELSLSIGKQIKRIKYDISHYPYIPLDLTRNDLLSQTIHIEGQWRQLCDDNKDLLKSEIARDNEGFIETLLLSETDRRGLRDFYLNSIQNEPGDPPHVICRGRVESVSPTKLGTGYRVVLKDLELREYSPNVPWSESELVDQLGHLNCFIDELDENLKPGVTDYFLARAISYHRGKTTVSHGNAEVDVSIKLLKWAPIEQNLIKASEKLAEFRAHLEVIGLEGCAKVHKKLRNAINFLNTDNLMVNTSKGTLNQYEAEIQQLNAEYELLKDYQEELIRENNELKRYERRLHELTLTAILELGASLQTA